MGNGQGSKKRPQKSNAKQTPHQGKKLKEIQRKPEKNQAEKKSREQEGEEEEEEDEDDEFEGEEEESAPKTKKKTLLDKTKHKKRGRSTQDVVTRNKETKKSRKQVDIKTQIAEALRKAERIHNKKLAAKAEEAAALASEQIAKRIDVPDAPNVTPREKDFHELLKPRKSEPPIASYQSNLPQSFQRILVPHPPASEKPAEIQNRIAEKLRRITVKQVSGALDDDYTPDQKANRKDDIDKTRTENIAIKLLKIDKSGIIAQKTHANAGTTMLGGTETTKEIAKRAFQFPTLSTQTDNNVTSKSNQINPVIPIIEEEAAAFSPDARENVSNADAFMEDISNECIGFSKQENRQAKLIRLNFPSPAGNKASLNKSEIKGEGSFTIKSPQQQPPARSVLSHVIMPEEAKKEVPQFKVFRQEETRRNDLPLKALMNSPLSIFLKNINANPIRDREEISRLLRTETSSANKAVTTLEKAHGMSAYAKYMMGLKTDDSSFMKEKPRAFSVMKGANTSSIKKTLDSTLNNILDFAK